MKLIMSHCADGWRRYALKNLHYANSLPKTEACEQERRRGKRGYRLGRRMAAVEQRHIDSLRRLKKALRLQESCKRVRPMIFGPYRNRKPGLAARALNQVAAALLCLFSDDPIILVPGQGAFIKS